MAMSIIKPYINAPEGMALKGDTGKFFSRWGPTDIRIAKDVKDPFTRFLVSRASDGKKILLRADTGKYWSMIGSGDKYSIEAAKDKVDVWCEFDPIDYEGKLALRGRQGLFLSRWGPDDVMAAKYGIDQYCLFVPTCGDIIPPKFKILEVTWDSAGESVVQKPSVVAEDVFLNNGSNPVTHMYDLKWTNKTTETTTWKQAWGFEFSYTYKTGLVASAVSSHEFMAKISYNGEVGGSTLEENEASFERKDTITVAPNKRTTVKMVVKKADDVDLPFTAKIERTNADGTKRIIYEQGTWSGVAYYSSVLQIDEEEL